MIFNKRGRGKFYVENLLARSRRPNIGFKGL